MRFAVFLTMFLGGFCCLSDLYAQNIEPEEEGPAIGVVNMDEGVARGVVNMNPDKYDPSKAFKDSLVNAQKGSQKAQIYVASHYKTAYENEGKDSDLESCIKWYSKAAENGNGYAMYELGAIYGSKDIAKLYDRAKSFEWYMKGDKAKNAESAYGLGCVYMQEDGLYKQNIPYAAYFLEKYIKLTEKELGNHPEEEGIQQFIMWPSEYRKACKVLGTWYINGEGVDKNPEKGELLIKKSSEDNFKSAEWWENQYEHDEEREIKESLKYWFGHWYSDASDYRSGGYQLDLYKDNTAMITDIIEQSLPLIGKVKLSVSQTGTYMVKLPGIEFFFDKNTTTCKILELNDRRVDMNSDSDGVYLNELAKRLNEMLLENDVDFFKEFNQRSVIIMPSRYDLKDTYRISLTLCDVEKDDCVDIYFEKGVGWY